MLTSAAPTTMPTTPAASEPTATQRHGKVLGDAGLVSTIGAGVTAGAGAGSGFVSTLGGVGFSTGFCGAASTGLGGGGASAGAGAGRGAVAASLVAARATASSA